MPVFTQNISNQQSASSSGRSTYPQIGQGKFGGSISDEFFREVLNPTNGYPIYTSSVVGTGTNTVVNGGELQLLTSATLNDNNCVRSSGLQINNYPLAGPVQDQRSVFSVDITFRVLQAATSQKLWVGLYNSVNATTVIPTEATARLAGIYVDTTGTGNFVFRQGNTAGNGNTDTDSGVALVNGTFYRLNITKNGIDSGSMTLYSSTNNFTTQLSTITISKFDYGSLPQAYGYELFFWVQTLTTAARELDIMSWVCTWS